MVVAVHRLELPELHATQQQIFDSPARFKVAFCGRRYGKTEVGVDLIIRDGLNTPGIYWWVGVSWKSASMKRAWRLLKIRLRGIGTIREADKEIHLPNGTQIWLRTGDNLSSLAGEGLRGAVLDEFTLMDERVWTEYIRASLSDYQGWALFIGVPKGRNWGWKLWVRGNDPEAVEWQSWQLPTSSNPYIKLKEIESAKGDLPERVYQQEYEAAVLDDGGAVFRFIKEASCAVRQKQAIPGHTYVAGIDLGKHEDFTVITIFDCTTRELVYIDRFNKIEYLFQIERLRVACELFRPKVIKIDRLGNDAVCEFLATCKYPDTTTDKDAYFPIEEFVANNANQAQTVQQLAIAFERRRIRIPADATALISELEAFGITKLPSGRTRYEAPSGLHDDCVRSLCLMYDAALGFTGYESMTLTERARRKLDEMREVAGIDEEVVQSSPTSDVTEEYLIQSIKRELLTKKNTHHLAKKLGRRGSYGEDNE